MIAKESDVMIKNGIKENFKLIIDSLSNCLPGGMVYMTYLKKQ